MGLFIWIAEKALSGFLTFIMKEWGLNLPHKRVSVGNSLLVQWLGRKAFTAVAWVQSLVRELRSRKPC